MDNREGLKMNLKLIKWGAIIAALVGLFFYLKHSNKPQVFTGPSTITNNGNNLVVQQPGKPPVTVYQPKPDTTVITTDPHGNVTVTVKQFGIGFDPGIGLAFADKARLTLDSRVVFYKRLGLNVGLAFSLNAERTLGDAVKPFLAASYALPFKKLSNTSVYAGMTLDQYIIGGLRVAF
jgi:hypothetical protein